ncbi:MAG: hypothetical protein COB42_06755 [Sulfurimonas sp.]|nr:MAG: hypothetical protein COB42_06755 [Sulfurimonas sp.]
MKLANNEISLTSLDISELTSKRHPDVQRDIKVQLGEITDVSKFAHIYKDSRNREQTMYILPKRECLILVSGYNVKLRAAIIDRLQFLEDTAPLSILKVVSLVSVKVRRAFFKAFEGKCYYSQKPLNKDSFHIDHILAKSRGGQDVPMNLVVCDPSVNISKLNAYDEDFVNKHQEIVKHNQALKVIAYLMNDNQPQVSSKDIGALLNARTMQKIEDQNRRMKNTILFNYRFNT